MKDKYDRYIWAGIVVLLIALSQVKLAEQVCDPSSVKGLKVELSVKTVLCMPRTETWRAAWDLEAWRGLGVESNVSTQPGGATVHVVHSVVSLWQWLAVVLVGVLRAVVRGPRMVLRMLNWLAMIAFGELAAWLIVIRATLPWESEWTLAFYAVVAVLVSGFGLSCCATDRLRGKLPTPGANGGL